jgi:hypothetical protein
MIFKESNVRYNAEQIQFVDLIEKHQISKTKQKSL